MGEKNDLGAASRKMLNYGCTNARGATLFTISYTHEGRGSLEYRNHDHLRVHQALRVVAGTPKVHL